MAKVDNFSLDSTMVDGRKYRRDLSLEQGSDRANTYNELKQAGNLATVDFPGATHSSPPSHCGILVAVD